MTRDPSDLSIAIVGYLSSGIGVGRAARLWKKVFEAITPATYAVDLGDPVRAGRHIAEQRPEWCGPVDIRVLCFNADETRLLLHHPLVRDTNARYTVGLWHWETDVFPWWMRRAFAAVDEVWAGSNYTRNVLAGLTTKNVRALSPPVPRLASRSTVDARAALHLSDEFIFLCEFDYRSVLARKNPLGTIKAFRYAFQPDEGPILLIKGVNSTAFPELQKQLATASVDRRDIIIWNRDLSYEQNNLLLASCDVYMSLHRAEGFGLTISEAASLGKPIITTGYSGPMDYLANDSSLLVPFELQRVGPGQYPYPRRGRWAEPDLGHAAKLMRWAWKNPDSAARLGARARHSVERDHSIDRRVVQARAALKELCAGPPDHIIAHHATWLPRWNTVDWRLHAGASRLARRVVRVAGIIQ